MADAPAPIASPTAKLPNGLDEIVAAYGNPFALGGDPSLWESNFIVTVPTPPALFTWMGRPVAVIRVNRRVAPAVRAAMKGMVETGLKAVPFARSYAWRATGDQLSTLVWGVAVEIGSVDPDFDAKVAGYFESHGFASERALRFQLATGYDVE